MYIVDGNVLEILDGSKSDDRVREWFKTTDETELFVSVISVVELAKGASKAAKNNNPHLPKILGRLAFLKRHFADRILGLDIPAAELWGRMLGEKDSDRLDVGIAATAILYDFTVVTRNVRDFEKRGAKLIDPFKYRHN